MPSFSTPAPMMDEPTIVPKAGAEAQVFQHMSLNCCGMRIDSSKIKFLMVALAALVLILAVVVIVAAVDMVQATAPDAQADGMVLGVGPASRGCAGGPCMHGACTDNAGARAAVLAPPLEALAYDLAGVEWC